MRARVLTVAAAVVALLLPFAVASAESQAQGPQEAGASGGQPLTFEPRGVTTDRFPQATDPEHVTVTAHDGVELHTRVFAPTPPAIPTISPR